MVIHLRIVEKRGSAAVEFTDGTGAACAIEEAGSGPVALWLGPDESHARGGTRMRWTPEIVSALLPFLREFAASGMVVPREGRGQR